VARSGRRKPVTGVDEDSKLVALWRARERLEVALAADESWQMLQRLGTGGAGQGRAAAGLQAQLLSNPGYRAWKNVNAAIKGRQPQGAGAAGPAALAQAAPAHPASVAPAQPGGETEEPSLLAVGALASEEEASVSFVARAPAPARMERPAQGAPHGHARSHDDQDPLPAMPAEEGSRCEEAEVSVVSVDARRHAGAVDRLLRALRGESQG